MGKKVDDSVLDGALNVIDANMTALHVNTAEPADRAAAISDSLADVAVDNTDGTLANGDTSGRKITIAQQSNVPIDASGTATHVAIISASLLLYVTTCTSQALTSGGTVTIPAWDIEIADPA
jgi:cytochrome c-type biogenesis protein CcmH/NrfG